MSLPIGFVAAQQGANNIGRGMQQSRDDQVIESILSKASASNDPAELQGAIGTILSKVSPERQPIAMKYLESKLGTIKEKQELERSKEAAQEAGYTYGAPSQVQAEQVKQRAKGQRLASYGLGGDQSTSQQQTGEVKTPQSPTEQSKTPKGGSPFTRMSDDQLIQASGAPDKEVSEPAKQELKRRQEENSLKQKNEEYIRKSNDERSKKVFDKADEIAESLALKESSLNLMDDALANKDLSYFSRDNLAEVLNIEGFRSPEGAIYKTAGKEYFLGNIKRAGARPNQWIEQQISDMMSKIGRSQAANFSVNRALRNELDLDKERLRYTYALADEYDLDGKDIPRDFALKISNHMSKYAEKKQIELYNDLRAIKAIDEGQAQALRKVPEGTEVSKFVVQALLQKNNNDPEKARKEAKELGYKI